MVHDDVSASRGLQALELFGVCSKSGGKCLGLRECPSAQMKGFAVKGTSSLSGDVIAWVTAAGRAQHGLDLWAWGLELGGRRRRCSHLNGWHIFGGPGC